MLLKSLGTLALLTKTSVYGTDQANYWHGSKLMYNCMDGKIHQVRPILAIVTSQLSVRRATCTD